MFTSEKMPLGWVSSKLATFFSLHSSRFPWLPVKIQAVHATIWAPNWNYLSNADGDVERTIVKQVIHNNSNMNKYSYIIEKEKNVLFHLDIDRFHIYNANYKATGPKHGITNQMIEMRAYELKWFKRDWIPLFAPQVTECRQDPLRAVTVLLVYYLLGFSL